MAVSSSSKGFLKLLIVVKARMNDGFCYIGWDMDHHKLVRPVLRQLSCRWLPKDQELQIGETHLFEVISFEPESSPWPHRAEDVHVKYRKRCEQAVDNFDEGELYDILMRQSRETVKEVFGNMDEFNGKFFYERTRCPSVGIYRCKRRNLSPIMRFRQGKGTERRCKITEEGRTDVFDFKITAVDDELPAAELNDDVLVVFGLTRYSNPYASRSACVIIIVGFVGRPCANTQQHSCFETINNHLTNGTKDLHSNIAGRKRKLEVDK